MSILFNARIDINNYDVISSDTYKITGVVVDNTGNFVAGSAQVGDVVYVSDSSTNSLQRFEITHIDSAVGANIVATVKWGVNGEGASDPIVGSGIIGRKNTKSNTITLTSTTVNMVDESLETQVRNYEQDLLISVMDNKETGLSNPSVNGQVLSSSTTGNRSWITLPSISDAINAVKGQPNGLAQLDPNGKLVLNEVPAIAITDVFTVDSETEMLALTAEKGDIASRTDDGYQYILVGDDASVLTNWKQLTQPVPVQSVNGKTGIVVLTTSDVAEGTNLYYTDARVASAPAVTDLQTKVNAIPTDLMTKSTYDANGDGVVDHAAVADQAGSVDYINITNKPSFATVATSGSYTDLTNTPVIPSKSSDLTLDNVYTKTEDNAALALKANIGDSYTKSEEDAALALKADKADVYTKTETDTKVANAGDMKKSVYDTNNSGVVDHAELADVANSVDYTNVTNKPSFATVATSGSYTDLVNVPFIPTKTSDLTLDNVYTKTENDTALALKADKTSVYTKTETDAALILKANVGDSYTKTEEDTALATKANVTDVYTKTEVDTKVANAGDMKKSIYDTNNSGVVDHAELADVANSVDYTNVTNKPSFATVATSGSYIDLINKPAIPSKTSDLTLDNVYTKTEDDAALALKANVIDVYTKTETDTKVASLINDTTSSVSTTYSANHIDTLMSVGSLKRYMVGEDIVLATGAGVTITKTANAATVNCPAGVMIVSLSVHFNTTNMSGQTSCSVDFGSTADYSGTGANTDYTNMLPPVTQVINDVAGSRAYKSTAAFSYNTNSHTLSVSGLLTGTAVWVRMTF